MNAYHFDDLNKPDSFPIGTILYDNSGKMIIRT